MPTSIEFTTKQPLRRGWASVLGVWADSTRRPAQNVYILLEPDHEVVLADAFRTLSIDTISHSLKQLFVTRISNLAEVERVFWRTEENRVRIWTIMDEPRLDVENQIYDAQLNFMDLFPEYLFDFSVIFRQGKGREQFSPAGATEVFARA